jgi:hypothetical protein
MYVLGLDHKTYAFCLGHKKPIRHCLYPIGRTLIFLSNVYYRNISKKIPIILSGKKLWLLACTLLQCGPCNEIIQMNEQSKTSFQCNLQWNRITQKLIRNLYIKIFVCLFWYNSVVTCNPPKSWGSGSHFWYRKVLDKPVCTFVVL